MTLVLRDSVSPEFAYGNLFVSVFFWLWTCGAYITTRNLQPMFGRTMMGTYSVIDSNSYLVFVVISVIASILTICCFRFKKHIITFSEDCEQK